jgi:hypothetical protein
MAGEGCSINTSASSRASFPLLSRAAVNETEAEDHVRASIAPSRFSIMTVWNGPSNVREILASSKAGARENAGIAAAASITVISQETICSNLPGSKLIGYKL